MLQASFYVVEEAQSWLYQFC